MSISNLRSYCSTKSASCQGASNGRVVRWAPRTFLGLYADWPARRARETVKATGTPSARPMKPIDCLRLQRISGSVTSSNLLQNFVGDIEVRVHMGRHRDLPARPLTGG